MEKEYSLFCANDSTDEDFYAYLYSKDEELNKVRLLCRERVFSVQKTGIPYRIINHWDEIGILPQSKGTDGKWRRFSFIEVFWLEVVKVLREYNVPLDTILEIKKRVLIWDEDKNTYPLLEYYLVSAVSTPLDPYLACRSDGDASIGYSHQIEQDKKTFGSRTLLLISFKEILNGLGMETSKPVSLQDITREEYKLLNFLKEDGVVSANLTVKNGKVKKINTEIAINDTKLTNLLYKLEKQGDFADLVTKFENGKVQSSRLIKKRRS